MHNRLWHTNKFHATFSCTVRDCTCLRWHCSIALLCLLCLNYSVFNHTVHVQLYVYVYITLKGCIEHSVQVDKNNFHATFSCMYLYPSQLALLYCLALFNVSQLLNHTCTAICIHIHYTPGLYRVQCTSGHSPHTSQLQISPSSPTPSTPFPPRLSTFHPSPSSHLTGPEGVPNLGDDGLIGSGVGRGVKHKHKIKYECISGIFFVLNTPRASYNAVARHVSEGRESC